MQAIFKRCWCPWPRGLFGAMSVALVLLLGARHGHAAPDSIPSLDGTWKLTNDADNRTLILNQNGRALKGKGLWANGTLSFIVEGDVSESGVVQLRFFLDRSDARGDLEITDALWDQAVQSRADAAHPGMLPIQLATSLDYVTHDGSLIGRRPMASIKHANDRFTEIKESTVTVRLVRIGTLQGTLQGVRDDVKP